MMTSSNGNIFRVTGHLCGEFPGPRWIPHTKASDAELGCFLWSVPWINGWVNNREAGDLRRHRAHYDVIVVIQNTRTQNTMKVPNIKDTKIHQDIRKEMSYRRKPGHWWLWVQKNKRKTIPMVFGEKWKHPGYLRPMWYMSDEVFRATGKSLKN